MSSKRIRAGKAEVEIGIRDRLQRGLAAVRAKLKRFGMNLAKIGAVGAAGATAVAGAFTAAGLVFAKAGDNLDKMSARTGIGSKKLSELAFAAERSGTDINAVEKSVGRMQRTISDAARGSGMAVDALKKLGLTADDLAGMTPEDQFELMADRLSKIEDPSLRAATAMEVFGRSGTALLPMIAGGKEGLAEMGAEADRLGLTLSKDQTDAAAKMTDAYGDMASTLKGVFIQVGSLVSGPLTYLFQMIADITAIVIRWIKTTGPWIQSMINAEMAAWGVSDAFTGVADALRAGDLALAAEIAFKGVQLVIAQVMEAVLETFGGTIDGMAKMLAELTKKVAGFAGQTMQTLAGPLSSLYNTLFDANLPKEVFQVIGQGLQDMEIESIADQFKQQLDPDLIRQDLQKLKEEAREAAEAMPDRPGRTAPEAPPIPEAVSNQLESVQRGFQNFAALSGRLAARQGPGAMSVGEKQLKKQEKMVKQLEDIKIALAGARGVVFS